MGRRRESLTAVSSLKTSTMMLRWLCDGAMLCVVHTGSSRSFRTWHKRQITTVPRPTIASIPPASSETCVGGAESMVRSGSMQHQSSDCCLASRRAGHQAMAAPGLYGLRRVTVAGYRGHIVGHCRALFGCFKVRLSSVACLTVHASDDLRTARCPPPQRAVNLVCDHGHRDRFVASATASQQRAAARRKKAATTNIGDQHRRYT